MGYEIPQCFLDKIEIDKKLQDFMKGSVVSFMDIPEFQKMKYLQSILRERCMFILAPQRPEEGGRPTQMAVAG